MLNWFNLVRLGQSVHRRSYLKEAFVPYLRVHLDGYAHVCRDQRAQHDDHGGMSPLFANDRSFHEGEGDEAYLCCASLSQLERVAVQFKFLSGASPSPSTVEDHILPGHADAGRHQLPPYWQLGVKGKHHALQ